MSFFGRAANLVKGGFKSLGRSGGAAETRDRVARERALEEELGRPLPSKPVPQTRPEPSSDTTREPPGGHAPPERDEQGNVKRTL
jgi:hypothetical protein